MANPEHIKILKQSVDEWNKWRDENKKIRPNLSEADLTMADLSESNLREANLFRADLEFAVVDLTIDQLCNTKSLCGAKFDDDLYKKIKQKCPELLKP